jgi:hypothetical protein
LKQATSLLKYSFSQSEKQVEQIALQKKLELKDELARELASKADLSIIESKLDKKITVWSVVIIAVVIVTNANSVQLLAQVLGLIK